MPSRFTPDAVDRLIRTLLEVRDQCLLMENSFADEVNQVDAEWRASARNLLHYLALRQQDLREIQRELAALGLSSLGRTEAHAMAGIDAVLAALHKLAGRPMDRPPEAVPPVDFVTGPAVLAKHSGNLLGTAPATRSVRIMVTAPSEAATHYALVRRMVAAGMEVLRINCAHDDPPRWEHMLRNLRRAERELGRTCRVWMDLGGPKLRTGQLEGGARLVRWRPRRSVKGRVVTPARVCFAQAGGVAAPPPTADAVVYVDGELVPSARRYDTITVADARGKKRRLVVRSRGRGFFWAEGKDGAYVTEGALVELRRQGRLAAKAHVRDLPFVEEPIRLHEGDTLILTAEQAPGKPARYSAGGRLLEPARIPCTLPEVFKQVRPGERIFFDDGKIGGIIRRKQVRMLTVEITQAGPRGANLRADKGINLPDSELHLPALTEKDLEDVRFAALHADMVGLSFVRDPEDVLALERVLKERGGSHLGILIKIENRQAFEQLPRLLLVGLQSPPIGVVVARGDLAVEMGFERLAEVQEEILWLCEAAHVPVIWATQVLETLAKKGQPSRAEVTDAAMSGRAECVMLNKGPHIVAAVKFLDNVLQRMQLHQEKKRSMLRRLSVSEMY